MFNKQTIRDIDLKGKTILLRADYNVPIKDGKITDDYRIIQSLPTVNYLLEHDTKLVICSHLGRPDGIESKFSMAPVAKRLKEVIKRDVDFVAASVGEEVKAAVEKLKPGGILLLENLRFNPGEKENDPEFSKQLAKLADIYVNDAFGVDHRSDASVDGITKYLPAVAGFLVENEMKVLTKVMQEPDRPLMAIIGGAKIADKIDVMYRFLEIADCIAVGGAMANTFLVADKVEVGDSLYDKAEVSIAKDIIKKADAEAKKRPFVFAIPQDVVVAKNIDKNSATRIVSITSHVVADIESYPGRVSIGAGKIHSNEKILDIGPISSAFIAGMTQKAKTVIWSGTMGVTETSSLQGAIGPTAHGSNTVIEAMIGAYGNKPYSIVGGGDTVGYVRSRNITQAFNHVSTGGSASLEVLAGHKMPGIDALLDKK